MPLGTTPHTRQETCECRPGCRTAAKITTLECRCVTVSIVNDASRTRNCVDFSGFAHTCTSHTLGPGDGFVGQPQL